ncbi:hypothetical protein [Amycolatopsis magusensis]|uniref:hypothetical protein n=1 Tax=Amycolatopsis magusensis TaxID=882444 RepID=UPI00378E0058
MRLEPGETETHLRALPGVLSASVVTVTAPDQPGCLTGFVVGWPCASRSAGHAEPHPRIGSHSSTWS